MVRIVVVLIGLLALLAIQAATAGWRCFLNNIAFPSRSLRIDMVFAVIGIFRLTPYLIILSTLGTSLLLDAGVRWPLQHINALRLHRVTGSPITDGIVYFLAVTFCNYWDHRLFHTSIGWRLHRLHHSGDYFSPLMAYRSHPIELALTPVKRMIMPFIFFGLIPTAVIVVETVLEVHGALLHLDAPWNFGLFGRWFLMSPEGHRLHHSRTIEHMNKNLSSFVLWDRLFGTWYDAKTEKVDIGLSESAYRHSFWRDILTDTGVFFSGLFR